MENVMRFSFVIPAYNASKYVARCLDSILGQNYSDFEVILIDDGSTDDTRSIAEGYAQRDARLRVFGRANGGQGAARNFGVKEAQGDWIWFVDSDDWIVDGSLERIASILSRDDPDVVMVNYARTFDHSAAQPAPSPPADYAGRIIDGQDGKHAFDRYSSYIMPPWRLITRRSLLSERGISFAEGVFYEDHPFAIDLMLSARRVYIDQPVSYAYYQHAGSTTHINDRKAYDFVSVRRRCLDLLKAHDAYARFPTIVCAYIAPREFFHAHVSSEHHIPFLNALNKELDASDEGFARQYGGAEACRFLDAVRAGKPSALASNPTMTRLRRLLTVEGRRRARFRLRWMIHSRLTSLARRALQVVAGGRGPAFYEEVGLLQVGRGARLEALSIDIRGVPAGRPYVVVGEDSHVGGRFVFERPLGQITVGAKSSIGGGSLLVCSQPGGIRIGNHVMLSWDVTVIDTNAHSLDPEMRQNDAYDWKRGLDDGRPGAYKQWNGVDCRPVVIEDGAWIGFGATILKGVTIGRGAVVGAKAVVSKDVAPYTVVAGNPARFVRLVPRDLWSWAEIVHAMRADPAQQQLMRDCYWIPTPADCLHRFRESPEFRETAALAREFCPHARTALDVGAGNGVASAAFALEGLNVVALEPSDDSLIGRGAIEGMARAAGEIDPAAGERVRIVAGVIDNAKIGGPFDVVLCRQATHHFPDPVQALKYIYEMLSPDGVVLLVREHVIYDDDGLQKFLAGHPMHRYYKGENAYTQDQYEGFAKSAGFEVARTLTFKDSAINYFPYSLEYATNCDERDHPGCMYTFVLRKPGSVS